MSCSAEICLQHHQHPAQRRWWLADGGVPQRIAALLAAELRSSSQRASSYAELVRVFEPLPPLPPLPALPAQQASYRYLIQLRARGAELSCWRRYPAGIGWQRRCGPMPLGQFVRRFSAEPRHASS